MKLTKTTLLSTALLSLVLAGQTATAGDAPEELNVYTDHPIDQLRVNYSKDSHDVNLSSDSSDFFPEFEH